MSIVLTPAYDNDGLKLHDTTPLTTRASASCLPLILNDTGELCTKFPSSSFIVAVIFIVELTFVV